MDYVSNTDIKKIYFIIYEKTNEHNKAEARVLFFLCIWAVVGLFFTVTIHVDVLLLKISLDTLKPQVFKDLTGVDELRTVLENISFMKLKGFKIELNFVATKKNVGEIESVYNYAHSKRLVGLKVLTVNDFGGIVSADNVEKELNLLIETL